MRLRRVVSCLQTENRQLRTDNRQCGAKRRLNGARGRTRTGQAELWLGQACGARGRTRTGQAELWLGQACGARGRTRTGMPQRAVDFESTASAIPPLGLVFVILSAAKDLKMRCISALEILRRLRGSG